jgi:predicted HD phosphohydrolase
MATQEQINDLFAKMAEERRKLLALLDGLSEGQAMFVPENAEGEAQWTAKEQAAHLASMETSYRAWVEAALARDGADVSGVAGERPAVSLEDANEHALGELVAELKSQRQKTLALMQAITPEQYERRASNRLFGSLTVMQWLRSYYRHDRMHVDQISGGASDYKPRWAEGMAEPDQRRARR